MWMNKTFEDLSLVKELPLHTQIVYGIFNREKEAFHKNDTY